MSSCGQCSALLEPLSLAAHSRRFHVGRQYWACAGCGYLGDGLGDAVTHALLEGHSVQKRLCPRDNSDSQLQNESILSTSLVLGEMPFGTQRSLPKPKRSFIAKKSTQPSARIKRELGAQEEKGFPLLSCLSETRANTAECEYKKRSDENRASRRFVEESDTDADLPGRIGFNKLNFEADNFESPVSQSDSEHTGLSDEELDSQQTYTSLPDTGNMAVSSTTNVSQDQPEISASEQDNIGSSLSQADAESKPAKRKAKKKQASKKEKKERKPKDTANRSYNRPSFKADVQLQCQKCSLVIRSSDVRNKANIALSHVRVCYVIRPYTCSGCGFRSADKVTVKKHIKRKCGEAEVEVVDRERNEEAIRAGLSQSFPELKVKQWRRCFL